MNSYVSWRKDVEGDAISLNAKTDKFEDFVKEMVNAYCSAAFMEAQTQFDLHMDKTYIKDFMKKIGAFLIEVRSSNGAMRYGFSDELDRLNDYLMDSSVRIGSLYAQRAGFLSDLTGELLDEISDSCARLERKEDEVREDCAIWEETRFLPNQEHKW